VAVYDRFNCILSHFPQHRENRNYCLSTSILQVNKKCRCNEETVKGAKGFTISTLLLKQNTRGAENSLWELSALLVFCNKLI
jgi:hypothetical protein